MPDEMHLAPTRPLRIATRGSALALEQTRIVVRLLQAQFPYLAMELVTVTTAGDADQRAPVSQLGDGAFVRGVEAALLDGRADIAVHSAKDVPTTEPPGLVLAAFPTRADARDAIVSHDGRTFAELPPGGRLGTSSPRRAAIARSLRPDIEVLPIRGNVDTRLKKLRAGEYDAIVLAAAGLDRLELHAQVTELCDPSVWVPAAGQGALAVQCRAGDPVQGLLTWVNDPDTKTTVMAERTVLRRLGSGCRTPVGINAMAIEEWWFTVHAMLISPDGRQKVIADGEGRDNQAEAIALSVAEDLISRAANLLSVES